MVHQPYEDWLLDDARLTPDQERDLRIHLRACPNCTALARANLALRAAPVITAPQGFASRFQDRLAAQRQTERKRSRIGMFLLGLVSLGMLGFILQPFFFYLTFPPEQVFALWVSNLIYAGIVLRTVSAIGLTLLNVASAFLPDYLGVVILALVLLLSIGLKASARKVAAFAKSAA
ncbi:MAG: hypothetical protein DDG60_13545 [Anaerolineae bacterium]|nr:MAG: hypothetical protein DDG60_13545 [Anaerolineae bacterium]